MRMENSCHPAFETPIELQLIVCQFNGYIHFNSVDIYVYNISSCDYFADLIFNHRWLALLEHEVSGSDIDLVVNSL